MFKGKFKKNNITIHPIQINVAFYSLQIIQKLLVKKMQTLNSLWKYNWWKFRYDRVHFLTNANTSTQLIKKIFFAMTYKSMQRIKRISANDDRWLYKACGMLELMVLYLGILSLVCWWGDVSSAPRPVGVHKLARRIKQFVGVGSKVVALGLNKVSWDPGTAVTVKESQSCAECWSGNSH